MMPCCEEVGRGRVREHEIAADRTAQERQIAERWDVGRGETGDTVDRCVGDRDVGEIVDTLRGGPRRDGNIICGGGADRRRDRRELRGKFIVELLKLCVKLSLRHSGNRNGHGTCDDTLDDGLIEDHRTLQSRSYRLRWDWGGSKARRFRQAGCCAAGHKGRVAEGRMVTAEERDEERQNPRKCRLHLCNYRMVASARFSNAGITSNLRS
jgi:hypothetical protein